MELRAADDDYAPNRWLAFAVLSDRAETLRPFLFDRAAAIRQECQRLLRGKFGTDPAETYRRTLDQEIAILGLGETGTTSDVAAVLPYLRSRRARVRRAAVQAIFRLHGEAHRETFLRVIATDTPAVSGQAAMALLAERDLLVTLIWSAVKANPNANTRWSVLRLLREKWKWSLLAVYCDAAFDDDVRIRELAVNLLGRWARHFERSFLQPTVAERDELAALRTSGRVPPGWEDVIDRALG